MKTKTLAVLLLLPIYQAAAQEPDASGIMDKSRELSMAGSMSANINLTILEKNGTTRSRTISMTTRSYPEGQEKRFIKFLEPADVRGTAMLIIDNSNSADEMWIYLPALKKTRRIVSSEKGKSFMSSEFSNADMSSPAPADFTNKHMEGSGINGKWIIESKPINEEKAEEYGYSRKISYLKMDKYQIEKMEFYNYDNELFKTIEISAIHQLPDGKYIVKDMTAENLINKRKSQIVMSKIVDGAKVDDSVFTLQNLEK